MQVDRPDSSWSNKIGENLATSKFETILRNKLEQHLSKEDTDKVILNLRREITKDLISSSLDDLEQLAKQKLKITDS